MREYSPNAHPLHKAAIISEVATLVLSEQRRQRQRGGIRGPCLRCSIIKPGTRELSIYVPHPDLRSLTLHIESE